MYRWFMWDKVKQEILWFSEQGATKYPSDDSQEVYAYYSNGRFAALVPDGVAGRFVNTKWMRHSYSIKVGTPVIDSDVPEEIRLLQELSK